MTKAVPKQDHIKDHDISAPVRRPRGRPRKDGGVPGKKRGSQTAHSPEHYAQIRYKRDLAGIIHKQFLILNQDLDEAERLLKHLTDRAVDAYHQVSLSLQPQAPQEKQTAVPEPVEYDPSADLEPVDLPAAPETPVEVAAAVSPPSLPEKETPAPRTPRGAGKPISERGKLSLKAFRK